MKAKRELSIAYLSHCSNFLGKLSTSRIVQRCSAFSLRFAWIHRRASAVLEVCDKTVEFQNSVKIQANFKSSLSWVFHCWISPCDFGGISINLSNLRLRQWHLMQFGCSFEWFRVGLKSQKSEFTKSRACAHEFSRFTEFDSQRQIKVTRRTIARFVFIQIYINRLSD